MSDRTQGRTQAQPSQPVEFPPSRFTLIYESKDGRLCLFEDADGHITAVRADKLA
ncbi:MAG: hypothetical protein IJ111_04560 [Eggerthellaceae bacterium]|nr:hypothetical protein [Eggerthellaceae bacterium]